MQEFYKSDAIQSLSRQLASSSMPAATNKAAASQPKSGAPTEIKSNKGQLYDKSTGVINLQQIGKAARSTKATMPSALVSASAIPVPTTVPTSNINSGLATVSKDAAAIRRAMKLFDRGALKLRLLFQMLAESSTHSNEDLPFSVVLDLGLQSLSPSNSTSPFSCQGSNCIYFQATTYSDSAVGLDKKASAKKKTGRDGQAIGNPGSSSESTEHTSKEPTTKPTLSEIKQAISSVIVLEGGHFESTVRAFNPHYLSHGHHHHFNACGLRMNLDMVTSTLTKQLSNCAKLSAATAGNNAKAGKSTLMGKQDSSSLQKLSRHDTELQETASLLYRRLMDISTRPQILILERISPTLLLSDANSGRQLFGTAVNLAVTLIRKNCGVVATDALTQAEGYCLHTATTQDHLDPSSSLSTTQASLASVAGTGKFTSNTVPNKTLDAVPLYSSNSMLPTMLHASDAYRLCKSFGIRILVLLSYDASSEDSMSSVPPNQPSAQCILVTENRQVPVITSHGFTDGLIPLHDLPQEINKLLTENSQLNTTTLGIGGARSSMPLSAHTNNTIMRPAALQIHNKSSMVASVEWKESTPLSGVNTNQDILCVFIDSKSASQVNTKGTTLNSRDKRLASASHGLYKEKTVATVKEKILSFFVHSQNYTTQSRSSANFTMRVGQTGKSSIVLPLTMFTQSSTQSKRPVPLSSLPYTDPLVFACDIPFYILRDFGTALISMGLPPSTTSPVHAHAHLQSQSQTTNTHFGHSAAATGSTAAVPSPTNSTSAGASSSLVRFLASLDAYRDTLPALKKDSRLLLSELSLSPALAATYLNTIAPSPAGSHEKESVVGKARVYVYSVPDDRFDVLVYDPVALGKTLLSDKLLQV